MDSARVVLILFLASIVNFGTSGALDCPRCFNALPMSSGIQQRQTSNSQSQTSCNQCEAIGEQLQEFNKNFEAGMVAGNSIALKDLYADDAVVFSIGRKPTFGGEGAAEKSGGYSTFFKYRYGSNFARYEWTVEDYGELDGMVWATGNGYAYNSTVADATPLSSMTYEKVWGYDDDDKLRLAINAFVY